jgi:type I restriction enzyme S subunit
MTSYLLQNGILQDFVPDHLVPQYYCDEPTLLFLQHIRREKAWLVKEGKFKKKNLEDM